MFFQKDLILIEIDNICFLPDSIWKTLLLLREIRNFSLPGNRLRSSLRIFQFWSLWSCAYCFLREIIIHICLVHMNYSESSFNRRMKIDWLFQFDICCSLEKFKFYVFFFWLRNQRNLWFFKICLLFYWCYPLRRIFIISFGYFWLLIWVNVEFGFIN